jgi:hypothetical protein
MAMNSTSVEEPGAPWRRLSFEQLTTFAGLTLAIVLLLVLIQSEGDARNLSGESPTSTARLIEPQAGTYPAEQVAFYIVDSEEQAELVRSWQGYEHALLAGDAGYKRTLYVPLHGICGADADALENSLATASEFSGKSFRLFELADCRNGPGLN